MSSRMFRSKAARLLGLALLGASGAAFAVDGVILIDQSRALAGNVTAGDTPGFPVSINSQGSYRLAGNLSVADPNLSVIEINASGVSIDLNGFTIAGPNACNSNPGGVVCSLQGSGIGVRGGATNLSGVTISNGVIRGMGNAGIGLAVVHQFARVQNVIVLGNGGHGIVLASDSMVVGSHASLNRGIGIWVGASSLIRNSISTQNNEFGLSLGGYSGGYAGNVVSGNFGGAVFGGVNMGGNACGSQLCP